MTPSSCDVLDSTLMCPEGAAAAGLELRKREERDERFLRLKITDTAEREQTLVDAKAANERWTSEQKRCGHHRRALGRRRSRRTGVVRTGGKTIALLGGGDDDEDTAIPATAYVAAPAGAPGPELEAPSAPEAPGLSRHQKIRRKQHAC